MEKSGRAREFDSVIAADDGRIARELADGIMSDYPYFVPAMAAALRNCGDYTPEERSRIVSLAAANIADRTALGDLVDSESGKFRDFYPETEAKGRSTMDAISHFLDTFGNDDEDEIKALEQKIFNPVPDYAQLLEKEERENMPGEEELEGQGLDDKELRINRFIALSRKLEGHFLPPEGETDTIADEIADAPSPKTPEEQADNSLLSESLAKIYIRQHRYEKALEIIMSLSLNFPEKSIYFADQIRFLRKLIVNEKYKNKK